MTTMMRIRIDLPKMYETLKGHKLPSQTSDDGYRVHAYLQQVYDGKAPTPFRVTESRGRQLDVLAYAETVPTVIEAGIQVASKTMPESFAEGTTLNFSLLACPVIRMSSAGPNHKKGAEVDVFLRECWRREASERVNRTEVYCQWLRERIASQGGARLINAQVSGYRRMKLLRKNQGPDRRSKQGDKPAVDFEGSLEVVDSGAFSSLVTRGIGRHRAFGFGMLLLKRGEC